MLRALIYIIRLLRRRHKYVATRPVSPLAFASAVLPTLVCHILYFVFVYLFYVMLSSPELSRLCPPPRTTTSHRRHVAREAISYKPLRSRRSYEQVVNVFLADRDFCNATCNTTRLFCTRSTRTSSVDESPCDLYIFICFNKLSLVSAYLRARPLNLCVKFLFYLTLVRAVIEFCVRRIRHVRLPNDCW